MSKGGSKAEETPQQRALVEYAVSQLQDYKRRWLPVQRQLAAQIQEMGKSGSAAREQASGKTTTDTAMSFARAEGALQKTLANTGANVGSSKAKLAMTGMSEDKAKATGLGLTIADQAIDDAYTKGLMALTAIGRGDRAAVANGMMDQARTSAMDAAASAEASAANRAGNAQMLGTAAGFGLQQSMQPRAQPQQPGISTTVLGTQADGFQTNPQAGW